ncbi:hypothetical protein GCM10010339_88870 [Streptomyces alanosinicus]|uniref:Uncharacterized protein n=1 Tax=Streptomyces alanosinicus TaxID=68171 RepID=A0A918YSJ0_9ACTN|nr:hypothetical protein GCM10010339_88870 [Streptomyces alanosinicus]
MGRPGQPFATIDQARQPAHRLSADVNVVVHLAGGTHRLSKPLTSGSADGGRNDHLPYDGIDIGWGWGVHAPGGSQDGGPAVPLRAARRWLRAVQAQNSGGRRVGQLHGRRPPTSCSRPWAERPTACGCATAVRRLVRLPERQLVHPATFPHS